MISIADAYWNFPVLAIMYDVNFVWYNVRDNVACACVNTKIDGLYKERTIEEKGFIKPGVMEKKSLYYLL